ncbi:MAG TPA: hypothetical protein VM782_16190 [Stellaceae bacterium]|nr:hypothetical protein [Stellaceae bacterium]
MTKQRATARLWSRTTQILGKFWAGVVSLPDNRRPDAIRVTSTGYPLFPPF